MATNELEQGDIINQNTGIMGFLNAQNEDRMLLASWDGIYKSIGMDDQNIINIYLFKNSIINIIGVVIGGLIGVLIMPSIMNAMTGSLGINEFPTIISYTSIFVSIGIVFAVTFLNALVIKRNISLITPKELLVE